MTEQERKANAFDWLVEHQEGLCFEGSGAIVVAPVDEQHRVDWDASVVYQKPSFNLLEAVEAAMESTSAPVERTGG